MKKLLSLSILFAVSAQAQLASDQVPHQRTLPVSEEVRRQLDSSRWHFGVFRVNPVFGIRDLGYDNNIYGTPTDQVSDWRSTVAAGARLIVPFGPKMYFRSKLVPEYTYYQKLTNRRSFGGDYGASLLGLYNRMSMEAGANGFRGVAPVSSEVERAALGTRTDGNANLEIDILRRLSVFGTVHDQRQRYSLTGDERQRGLSLQQLERNENVGRAGIRYRFATYLDISTAVEKTRTNFVTATDRNNEGSALIFGVRYDRPRTFVNLSVGSRTGEPRVASSFFPRYSETSGSYYASHELASRILLDVYGNRGVTYSLTVSNPYYVETLNGAGLVVPVGQRIAIRAYGEGGTNKYPLPVQSIKRTDDVTTYGGGFVTRLYRNIAFVTLASRKRLTSNVPGQDRSIFRLTTALTFGGDLYR